MEEELHEEKKQDVAAVTGSQVGDLHVPLRLLTPVTKVVDGRRVKDTTKDLRICGKDGQGSHPFKNVLVDGWYCRFCL